MLENNAYLSPLFLRDDSWAEFGNLLCLKWFPRSSFSAARSSLEIIFQLYSNIFKNLLIFLSDVRKEYKKVVFIEICLR